MILAYNDLIQLMIDGVVTNIKPQQINSASIDLTLGDTILYEDDNKGRVIDLAARDKPNMIETNLDIPFVLQPGQFCLACTEQKFYLPKHISCEYKLKSSMARAGLEHLTAGWCDAGWHDSVLTLEFKNMLQYHPIILKRGMPIGQMVFHLHAPVPMQASYACRGRYNNDASVSEVKE